MLKPIMEMQLVPLLVMLFPKEEMLKVLEFLMPPQMEVTHKVLVLVMHNQSVAMQSAPASETLNQLAETQLELVLVQPHLLVGLLKELELVLDSLSEVMPLELVLVMQMLSMVTQFQTVLVPLKLLVEMLLAPV